MKTYAIVCKQDQESITLSEKLKEQALEKLAPGIIQESKTAWQKDGDLMEFLKALQVKYK